MFLRMLLEAVRASTYMDAFPHIQNYHSFKKGREKKYMQINVLGHSAEQGGNNKEQLVRVKLIGYQSLSKSTHPLKSAESASRSNISLVRRGQNKSQRLCQIEVWK